MSRGYGSSVLIYYFPPDAHIRPYVSHAYKLHILSGVNANIVRIPISSASFPVYGLVITIFCHLSVPLLRPFPPELEISLRIIRHLRNHRGLNYCVLVYATLSTVNHLIVDVESLVDMFGHWEISACVLNTAPFGDVIASFRLVIIVKFVTDFPTLKIRLSPVASE